MAQQFVIFCVALAAAMVGYALARPFFVAREDDRKLRGRLGRGGDEEGAPALRPADVREMMRELWARCSGPFMPKTRAEQARVRKMLGQAGIYDPKATKVFVGCKVAGMAGGMAAGAVVGAAIGAFWLGAPFGAIIGFVAPVMYLRLRVRGNAKEIERGMADALDLMVVCMEAGLTIDAAMQRVGQELSMAHPALSRELGITHMETRVGIARAEAMRNLGERTGVPSLMTLAAMLGQAERFGTSIASALRVHAEGLRVARQTAAEELAAKASVKMSFPLVMFIFPATFIVLAGPTVVQLLHSALFN